jgi:hypothetical protein
MRCKDRRGFKNEFFSAENLSLFCNCIGPHSAEKIAEALSVNHSLQSIDLTHNNINDDILQEINQCIEKNANHLRLEQQWLLVLCLFLQMKMKKGPSVLNVLFTSYFH